MKEPTAFWAVHHLLRELFSQIYPTTNLTQVRLNLLPFSSWLWFLADVWYAFVLPRATICKKKTILMLTKIEIISLRFSLDTQANTLKKPPLMYNTSTGGPSSSCEMIILRNNGHGGITRVCMGIFTSALRNKKICQILSERLIREAKNPSSKWLGGHKSNAESKHIYCSFISIHYKLNLPRATDAKPQFASKISSLEVSNSPRPHQPWHTTVETLPPFQTEPRRGPHRQLLSINCKMIISQLELGPPVTQVSFSWHFHLPRKTSEC